MCLISEKEKVIFGDFLVVSFSKVLSMESEPVASSWLLFTLEEILYLNILKSYHQEYGRRIFVVFIQFGFDIFIYNSLGGVTSAKMA